jgi:hypothetical protein
MTYTNFSNWKYLFSETLFNELPPEYQSHIDDIIDINLPMLYFMWTKNEYDPAILAESYDFFLDKWKSKRA